MMTFRILSLDGGGSWALIQAAALARLYPGLRGREVLSHFDLATGNSGGSIVLAALLADYAPAAIVSLFLNPASRAKLYRPVGGLGQVGAALGAGARWSSAGKLAGLQDVLGEAGAVPVSQLARLVPGTHIMFPAYDVDAQRTVYFRSFGSSIEPTTLDSTLALAVHASSTAPVLYFDEPAVVGGVRLWDGAIGGLNNPVLAAALEAQAAGAGEVAALSLGTAGTWLPPGPAPAGEDARLYRQPRALGTLGGLKLLAKSVIGDPPDAATLHADIATGGGVVRLNPMMRPVPGPGGHGWVVPAGFGGLSAAGPTEAFARAVGLDMDLVTQPDVELVAALAHAWLDDRVPNQATAMNALTGECVRGHDMASAAIAAWRTAGR